MALATIQVDLVETENNITRSGTSQIVDATVAGADTVVLLTQQTSPAQNGVYVVSSGTWGRLSEFATNTQMLVGTTFFVKDGSPDNAGSEWYFDIGNLDPESITVDATALYFARRSWPSPVTSGTGTKVEGGMVSLREQEGVQGIYTNPVVEYDSRGIAVYTSSGLLSESLLDGAGAKYLSANSLEIGEGQVWIPGDNAGEGALLEIDTPITKSGLSLTAGAWHYVYAWDNGGLPDVEVSTQVPARPYYGLARVKGGPDNVTPDASPDETRRLIWEVYAPAVNTMRRFQDMGGGFIRWVADLNSTLTALSGSTATTATDLDVSPFAPVHADGVHAMIRLINSDNPSTFYVTAAGDGLMTSGGSESAGQLYATVVNTSASRMQASGPIAFAGSRTLRHRQSAVGASRQGEIQIMGYYRRRS